MSLLKKKNTKERIWATAISAVISSGPAFLVGVTLGFPSVVLVDLDLSNTHSDIFGALAPIGALFGSIIAGFITSMFGRKGSLLLVMIPYMIGYLILTYSQYVSNETILLTVLYIGRFFTGIGLGWSCLSVPVYHAEISSHKIRGLFGSFTQLFLSFGLFVVYSLSTIHGFRFYQISIVIAGVLTAFTIFMLFIPESPRWLLLNGKMEEATRVVCYLRGPMYPIDQEIHGIENDILSTPSENIIVLLKTYLCNSRKLKPVLVMLSVMFLQQMSGLNAGSAYASVIFKEAGVSDPSQMASYVVGGTSIVFTLLSVFTVDYFGRKLLLLFSGIGMLFGTVILGTHFYVTRPSLCINNTILETTGSTCNSHIAPLAITGLVIFYATFSVGWGPVPWILLGELLPLNIRSLGGSLAIFVNWGTAAIVTGFYFNYSELVNSWFAWWTFSIFNCIGVIFVVIFVRETKGKSLEDLSRQVY